MTGRLRDGIGQAWAALLCRLRPWRGGGAAVKGSVKNIIVVKPDDPAFKEALFILRDDYFSTARRSRNALMVQAKEAARRYTDSIVPPRKSPLLPVLLSVLMTSAVFIVLILMGIV